MKVNVIVNRAESIPKTAEITGVSEEEIHRNFDECQRFGKPYVFNVDMSEEQFKKAVWLIQNGPANDAASNDTKLKFYSFYKQATVGKCNTARPGMLDLVGKAKWYFGVWIFRVLIN